MKSTVQQRNISIYIEKYPGHYDAHYREIPADVIGDFAVHPASGMDGEYTLTHIPTGGCIASTLYIRSSINRGKTALLDLAKDLNRCGVDWSFSLEEITAKDKETLEKLKQAKSIVNHFYRGIREIAS